MSSIDEIRARVDELGEPGATSLPLIIERLKDPKVDEEEAFRLFLITKGVLLNREPVETPDEQGDDSEPPLVEIHGNPLSQTVIEERR